MISIETRHKGRPRPPLGNIQIGWMAWAAMVIGVIIALPAFAASPSQVQEQIAEAVADQQKAGREMAAWEAERNEMLREIERLNIRIKYLDHQKSQYGAYTERRRAEIARLERRAEAVGAMNLALAPFLSEVADRLTRFIQGDMAFLTGEREQRMEGVREALTDYRLSLDEKFRRVLEALTVEVQYGHSVDTGEATVVIDGTPRRVETLRLGRVAQYYRSTDGRAVGMRTPSAPDWRPLPPGDARSLGMAAEMADRRRIIDLVRLPVERPAAP